MCSLHAFNYGPPQDYDDYPDQNPFAPPDGDARGFWG
jgi:hypothetical protein